jgi:hypothetical protein
MQEFYEAKTVEESDENTILNQIKCELHKGVQDTLYDPRFYPPTDTTGRSVDWLKGWGAKVALQLTVDEKGSLNPGLNLTEPLHKAGTLFSFGFGIQTSSEASRQESIAATYAFNDLLLEGPIAKCSDENGILIHSDLKIGEFISNKAYVTRIPGTLPPTATTTDPSGKPKFLDALSYEAKFIVIYGANATPGWTFVRLSVNPAQLASAMRTKTQDVLITLGEVTNPARPPNVPPQLSSQAETLHNARLSGQSVNTALQNLTTRQGSQPCHSPPPKLTN